MSDPAALAFLAVLGPLMLAETWWSAHNEALLRRAGAVEPPGDVYGWMLVAYPAGFVVMGLEHVWAAPIGATLGGGLLFALAKALKYWAIGSLGPRWCFRVLVPPGASAIARGPYRWMRHPNYVAVVLEFVAAALVLGAWRTGPLATATFMLLLWRRIGVEERALGLR